MKKYLYESSFAELTIKPMVSAEKDKCLALASLKEVQNFLPNVDAVANVDLLPVAFNACVVNRVNKNKDVIDTDTALAMYKQFIHKPINVEHNRQKVVGMILTAGFSEFGSDIPLSEEQVKGMTGPFNVTLGGVLWRVVSPELAEHVEDSSDPTSDKYLSVSASWELGFSEYKIALMEGNAKNLSEAKKIITDAKEIESVKDKLTSLGGAGKIEDLFAYRMPAYDVLPLGIGFTEKPAAEVKGIAIPSKEEVGTVNPPAFGDKPVHTETPKEVKIVKAPESKEVGIIIPTAFSKASNQNKISQSEESDVKIKRTTFTMKLNSIKDLTDENLKECSASVVSEFIASEIKKGSDEWETKNKALSNQLAEAKSNDEKLKAEQTQLTEQLKQMQATVQSLATDKAEREKVEQFNARMASLAEEYDLDDEARSVIVDEIKALASDEAFTKWQTKAKVLLKGYAKSAKKAKADDMDDSDASKKKAKADDMDDSDASKKKADDKKDEKKDDKKAKASEATASVVADAIDNGDKSKNTVVNTATANEPSLKEKYKEAFARENFVITV